MKKWFFSYRNNDISCTHARTMLPCEKILKKCAISCVLVNILIRFCIRIVLLKCSLCIEQYDIMLMDFQGIFPMDKHEI